MAEYGYARRGYVPEGKSTYDSNGWAKTGEEYEDQVCTYTIDAEGRKIISCTPNPNTEDFVTKTETIIEHVTGYGDCYDADTNGWNRPSGNTIREPRFDVPLSKPTNDIETAVDYLKEPTKAPFATTTGTRPRWAVAIAEGSKFYEVQIDRAGGLKMYGGFPPMCFGYRAELGPEVMWRQKPKRNTRGGYTDYGLKGAVLSDDTNGRNRRSGNTIREPRFDVLPSKPTNDIEIAIEYLTKLPTVDRTEGVKYGGFPATPQAVTAADYYTPTIDSVEAARRYGGGMM